MINLLPEKNASIDIEKTISFSLEKKGWYEIVVAACTKSAKQRGEGQTDDEELTIQIDNTSFPKPGTKDGLLTSPAAFSGGSQHGEEKVVYFVMELFAGNHTLVLTPQHAAIITKIWYEPLEVINKQLQISINQQPTNRENSPWLTFVLVGGNFIELVIVAKVWWHWRKGDNLQVRINSQIIPNLHPWPLFNNQSIFRSRPIIDLFGRKQTEKFVLSSDKHDLQYVELWADRQPLVNTVSFTFDKLWPQSYPQLARDQDYNRFDFFLAEQTAYWNKYFFDQPQPPFDTLDPSLIKAMMYVESRMGYYSGPEGFYPAFPDVMQIGDPRNPAIHTLNNDGWISPSTQQVAKENEWTDKVPRIMDYKGQANGHSPEESIHWAILWLFHKAEIIHPDGSRGWRSWEEAVSRYNGGGDTTYQKKVWAMYLNGPQKK